MSAKTCRQCGLIESEQTRFYKHRRVCAACYSEYNRSKYTPRIKKHKRSGDMLVLIRVNGEEYKMSVPKGMPLHIDVNSGDALKVALAEDQSCSKINISN